MSAALFNPGDDDTGRLIQAATAPRDGGQRAFGGGGEGGAAFTPVTVRSAALAALALLGAADDEHVDDLDNLMREAKSADCMKMAKLNLYQCLAVAGPQYEDVFCLGQHALSDTAQCVSTSVGGDLDQPCRRRARSPRRAPGFMVPVGGQVASIGVRGTSPRPRTRLRGRARRTVYIRRVRP
jgi:hypothetical protein